MKFSRLALLFLFLTVICAPAWAGNVSGKVKFQGTAPAPAKLDMSTDPACGGGETEDAVVAADGSIKNVFVYIKEGVQGNFPAPNENVVLDQKGCRYIPRVLGLQAGQTLEIVNSDSTLHNVHGLPANSKQFNLGMPIQGMKIKRKFDKPEVMVKFKCDVHPWMNAWIGVLTHPFFAVTGDDGSFEIKNLPPGEYTVEAWHEKFGTRTGKVTVADSGAQTLDFNFQG